MQNPLAFYSVMALSEGCILQQSKLTHILSRPVEARFIFIIAFPTYILRVYGLVFNTPLSSGGEYCDCTELQSCTFLTPCGLFSVTADFKNNVVFL